MKLLRYGEPGHELPGVLDDDGNIRSLRGIVADIDGPALAGGVLRDVIIADLPVVNGVTRLGPCVGKVGKFLCVGLNYADHAAESGMPVPPEPEIFTKATSAICGPNDDIIQPRDSTKLDWEVELGRGDRQDTPPMCPRRKRTSTSRVMRLSRPLRARLPVRARRPVGQGQGMRHLRADRAVAGHAR